MQVIVSELTLENVNAVITSLYRQIQRQSQKIAELQEKINQLQPTQTNN